MSRILRRPMFRGGMAIDSRGTGITSGLYDGDRVGLSRSFPGTAGDAQASLDAYKESLKNPVLFGQRGIGTPVKSAQRPVVKEEDETEEVGFLQGVYDFFNPSEETVVKRLQDVEDKSTTFDEKMENIGVLTNKRKREIAEEAKKQATAEAGLGDTSDLGTELENQAALAAATKDTLGDEESKAEVSAQDMIRENAELFKELLGEASKEDIKKARIQDASDYLLKFFEGTSQGKGIKEAAGDVAGFATGRDSRTDRAREAMKKTDQTATALAINDYIAGKRSKEEVSEYFAKLAGKKQFETLGIKEQLRDAAIKSGGPLPVTTIVAILDAAPGSKGVVRITEQQVKDGYDANPDGSDDGKFFVEENTKKIFKVVGTKKVPL